MDSWSQVIQNIQVILNDMPKIHIKDIIEIGIISTMIYNVLKYVRGTRAWTLIKGIFVLLAVSFVAMVFELNTILWLFGNAINVGIIAIIIVFQPELRRALEQLGRKNIFSDLISSEDHRDSEDHLTAHSINEIVRGVETMAKHRTGALMVIEQNVKLGEYERTGIYISALISHQLIINIFEHNTPLHDGAVIIRNNRIISASCFLPLSDNMTISKELGTRHRAGVGISEVSDAIVIIVSEETGRVSLCINGTLMRDVDLEYLRNKLLYLETKDVEKKRFKLWKGWSPK